MKKIENDQKQLQINILKQWQKYQRRQKRNRSIINNINKKKSYNTYRIFFNELNKIMKQSLKYTINKIANKTSLIEANYKQHSEQMDQIDQEKQELCQQIAELEEQIQYLQEREIQKDTQNLDLKKIISKLETDIETINIEKEEMEKQVQFVENDGMQKLQEYQQQVEGFDEKIQGLTKENERLQELSNQLTDELNYQHDTLHRTEKKLLEKSDQANRIVKETEEKLQNSIMMADEFKQKIMEQENIIENLSRKNQEQEDQRNQLTQKLEKCMNMLSEQDDMYNLKVIEQQKTLNYCDEKLKNARQTNSYLRNLVSEMTVDLKKYEYEVDLLQDDNHKKTQDFIYQVNSNNTLPTKQQQQLFTTLNKTNNTNYLNINSANDFDVQSQQLGDFKVQQNEFRERMNNLNNNVSDIYQSQQQTQMHQRKSSRNYQTFSQHNTTEPADKYDNSILSPSLGSPKYTPNKFQAKNLFSTTDGFRQVSNLQQKQNPINNYVSPARKLNEVLSPVATVSKDLEKGKSGRKKARNELEQRIKQLSQNLETDLAIARDTQLANNNNL